MAIRLNVSVPFERRLTRSITFVLALAGSLLLVACGGGGDSPAPSDGTVANLAPSDSCDEPELVNVQSFGDHDEREFTAEDYDTNPPAGGDHNPNALPMGTFYTDPPPLGQTVHALEHGAVIGWTNGLSKDDQAAVEDAFNEIYDPKGYFQIAVVENPDMEVPFALSAWGVVQKCEAVESAVIKPFIEANYASDRTAEGDLACPSPAKIEIPACES